MLKYFLPFSILFMSFSVSAAVKPYYKQRLPVYRSILDEVAFWENIFSKYHSAQCVYHDMDNLNIVYLVKNLSFKNSRMRNKQIAKYERSIQNVLKNLEKGKKPKTFLERRVHHAIPKHLRNKKSFYKKARYRVRCQRGLSDSFKLAIKNSKKYLPTIKRELRRQGMPEDIAYLPHLESGFNNKARSKVGARGLWQLMPSLAREGGLKVNRYRDDRINTQKATRFAIKKLKKYYKETKAWGLALTSYNYGINGIKRAIKKYGTNDYSVIRERHKTRIFGFAAKNFYPSYIAVRNLARKHEQRQAKKTINVASSKR